ncbi:MAG: DUF2971 domain-containing protein [Planctomycetota bacterium]|nr:DUF2971 domain-containing protein [Planctomycetota bacterium]
MKNIDDSDSQLFKDTPEVLYKYRSLSEDGFEFTRNIFLKNELYFPHPKQINDPFDCKIPPSFKNVTKESLIACIEKVESKNYGINAAQIEAARNNVNCHDIETLIEAMRKQDEKGHRENAGVLSLSEKWSNILMWSHYADSHRGICIGFDFTKLLFVFNGTPFPALAVKYPELNDYPLWEYLDDDHGAIFNKQYLTKALDWEYEREWRVVLPEKGRTSQEFEPAAIVSVHLGCQISERHKENVVNWCLQREQKPRIYETAKDESSYSLQEKEITY